MMLSANTDWCKIDESLKFWLHEIMFSLNGVTFSMVEKEAF